MATSNKQRQQEYRDRKRRNATVTAQIGATETVTEGSGIVYRNGHQYYTTAKGQTYAVVCCGADVCAFCGGRRQ